VTRFTLSLPPWVPEVVKEAPLPNDDAERAAFATLIARENVRHRTGGPFGAALFSLADGALLSVGVNLVVPGRCSSAHAEIVALSLAQARLGTHDLTMVDGGCVLVSSVEPCAMCLGAIPWAGVRRLITGARDDDARAIGFDEGAKPHDWVDRLENRGIEVSRDLGREAAVAVLREYVEAGGEIYNAGD
jgi:tRNA(Arg) A34 adenosine deaminase TadA